MVAALTAPQYPARQQYGASVSADEWATLNPIKPDSQYDLADLQKQWGRFLE